VWGTACLPGKDFGGGQAAVAEFSASFWSFAFVSYQTVAEAAQSSNNFSLARLREH
jgi:hypothetical protein